jgi:hypothetical protein
MFDVRVYEFHVRWAMRYLKNNPVGRGPGAGTYKQQVVGMTSQGIVQHCIFGLPLPKKRSGFDGGFDFICAGKNVDVKSMGREVSVRNHYVNNFYKRQSDFNCNIYIFCSLNTRKMNGELYYRLTICGWIDKENFLKKADLFKKGTRRNKDNGDFFYLEEDMYEIGMTDLNDVCSGEELITAIKNWEKK